MFHSGKQRERADEEHICTKCLKSGNCDSETDMIQDYSWRYVLTYCQIFEELILCTSANE